MINEDSRSLLDRIRTLLRRTNRICLMLWIIVSVLFGVVAAMTPVYRSGSEAGPALVQGVAGAVIFAALSLMLSRLADWMERNRWRTELSFLTKKRVFLIAFCAIAATCGLYLMVYYPGTTQYDTIAIIQGEGTSMMSQHPWFYIVLVRALRDLVFRIGGGV